MGLKRWAAGLTAVALMLPGLAAAGEAGDLLRTHLYEGTIDDGLVAMAPLAQQGDPEAKFALGMLTLVDGLENASQDLYRYGAVVPQTELLGVFGVLGPVGANVPANPHPEPVTYDKLRELLQHLVTSMDTARGLLEEAGAGGDYVVALEPLKFRFDANGDGVIGPEERLGELLGPALGWTDMPVPDLPPPSGKHKGGAAAPEQALEIGFDRADALWLAGYSQVIAAPADFALAHDFHDLVDAYFHRIFPLAGLPMQDEVNGTLAIDPTSDSSIADLVAALHTLNFPVIEPKRLAGVRERLLAITALSRLNWDAILAESDDNHELVPSPRQTPLNKEAKVDEATVKAWMATLDTLDQLLEGHLLVPHWRFKQGFDLKAYFETATRTDFVMIVTGLGAVPFLKEGPVVNAESFAEANKVFGEQWLGYAFWFN